MPFAATWMKLEGITLSEKVSQRKTDTIWFHSYVDPEKLNRNPWGRGREKKKKKRLEWEREPKHKRLLKTENKLRVVGGWEGGEDR